MIIYNVTKDKPTGKMYHGPGNPYSAYGLSLYHLTNSVRGVQHADALGYKQIDLDLMTTKDNVLVCNHSFGFMEKEHFYDPEKRIYRRSMNQLTFKQAHSLIAPGGYRIQRAETLLEEATEHNMTVLFDLKGNDWERYRLIKPETFNTIAEMANDMKAKVAFKCDPKNANLRRGIGMARNHGFWARYNGFNVWLSPKA